LNSIKTKVSLSVSTLLVVSTSSALAAEDILKIDKLLIFQIVIFIAAIFILNSLLFKPLLELVDKREKLTTGTIKEANELREKIELIIKDYNARLDQARAQALEERNEIRRKAQTSAEELLQKARQESQALLNEAKQKLETEKGLKEEKIKPDIEYIARDVASRILGKEI